jgi:GT2 family glycosyltransferase
MLSLGPVTADTATPEPAEHLVSVLVVNWNTRDLTLACIDSLGRQEADRLTLETVVVDNGSVDGSREVLDRRPDIHFVANPSNVGYAAAVNQAFTRAGGDLVLLLNSDVELPPRAVAALAAFLDDHPDAAGVAPLYLNPDGTPQAFHFRFPTFPMLLANVSTLFSSLPGARARERSYRMLDDDFSTPRRVDQPSASCLLLRRSALPRSGVFDERYPIFFNDVRLAQEIAGSGGSLWVVPAVKVKHEGHASTRQLGPVLKRQYLASLMRLLEDTAPASRRLLLGAVVLAQGLVARAVGRADALPVADLVAALRGDPGRLPAAPQSTGRTA